MKLLSIFALAMPLCAQLSQPNRQGVAMGHIHLNAADPDAAIAFWTDVIGATTYTHESLKGVSTLGVIILFTRKAPTGPSAGSAVDHIGFNVADLQPFQDRLKKTSYKSWQPKPGGDQLMIDGPDGVRVELSEDNSQYNPIEFHHIHFRTANPKEMQAWYQEHFGARPGTRDQWEAADIPGANLTFAPGESPAPTQGRAIDHIGFEVKGLESFCKMLTDSGVKLDAPYRTMPQIKLSLAFLTDPWGTRIELTEGLAH